MKDEWKPLLNESDEGFLIGIPVLKNTPPYKTSVPSNAMQVLKCFDSNEERIGNENKMTELRKMYEHVYSERIDNFHWNIRAIFETNSKCILQDKATSDVDEEEENNPDGYKTDSSTEDLNGLIYRRGSFAAVRSSDNSPFWIAKMQEFNVRSSTIRVLWYEGKVYRGINNPYEYKYTPLSTYESVLHTDTVHLTFSGLNSNQKLGVTVSKALRQVLGQD